MNQYTINEKTFNKLKTIFDGYVLWREVEKKKIELIQVIPNTLVAHWLEKYK